MSEYDFNDFDASDFEAGFEDIVDCVDNEDWLEDFESFDPEPLDPSVEGWLDSF